MPKISHSSMGQTRESKQQLEEPRTYVVDDPAQAPQAPSPQLDLDDRLAQFGTPPVQAEEISPPENVAYKMPEKKPVSEALQKLIFIGRLTKEVEIGGVVFEISSLTNKEHYEILQTLYTFTDPADLFTVRILTLANCLKKIDGVPLGSIEIEGEFESSLHKRMSIVDHLQLSVVEKLFDEYEELVKVEDDTKDEEEEVKN